MSSLVSKYEEYVTSYSTQILIGESLTNLVLLLFLREGTLFEAKIAQSILNVFDWTKAPFYDRVNIRKDERFKLHYKTGRLLQIIRCIQLVVEMGLLRSSQKKRFTFIIILEAVKCLIKLYSAFSSHPEMHIDPNNLPFDEVLVHEVVPEDLSPIRNPRYLQRKPTDLLMIPFDNLLQNDKAILTMRIGEVLNAIRPLLYACLLSQYGFQSWRPWVTSALVDIASFISTRTAFRKSNYNFGVVPIDEMYSRRSYDVFMNYLFKSPIFNYTLQPVMERFVDTMGWVGGPVTIWVKYMLLMSRYFYYTEK
ncbi:peroxisome biogenesis protein [Acrasis kona]|uniref:Peroxisomal membrane protein PEX16 n=1 Tax=Acrasis kona TaxID=1008807 RepID=A0AAW2Z341_9EUKA